MNSLEKEVIELCALYDKCLALFRAKHPDISLEKLSDIVVNILKISVDIYIAKGNAHSRLFGD